MPSTRRKSIQNKKNICEQCKLQIIEESDDSIECDKCAKKYHSQCTQLDKRQFEYFLNNESEVFACHKCEGGDGGLQNELKAIKTKLNKLDQLSEIQETIQFMSKQYDDILRGVAENKKKLSQMEKENLKLRKEVNHLKSSVKLLNDDRVKNNCIVRGLVVAEGATAVEAVVDLSKNLGVDMEPQNIDDAYFLRNKSNNNKNSSDKKSLIVKFSSKSSKEKLMSVKPKLKENKDTSEVFVNDYLSKETLNLLQYARTLKKVGYNHVFARSGRVFYKRSDISRPQLIRCEEDVDKILLNATTNAEPWKRRSLAKNNPGDANEDDANEDDATSDDDRTSYVSP